MSQIRQLPRRRKAQQHPPPKKTPTTKRHNYHRPTLLVRGKWTHDLKSKENYEHLVTKRVSVFSQSLIKRKKGHSSGFQTFSWQKKNNKQTKKQKKKQAKQKEKKWQKKLKTKTKQIKTKNRNKKAKNKKMIKACFVMILLAIVIRNWKPENVLSC